MTPAERAAEKIYLSKSMEKRLDAMATLVQKRVRAARIIEAEYAEEIAYLANAVDYEQEAHKGTKIELRELQAENAELRTALADAIRRPMGIVPVSAERFTQENEK